jgi:hypothetical protein
MAPTIMPEASELKKQTGPNAPDNTAELYGPVIFRFSLQFDSFRDEFPS